MICHICTSVHTVLQSGFNDASQERCSCVWFAVRAAWSLYLPSRIAAFLPRSEEFKSYCIDLCSWPVGVYGCLSVSAPGTCTLWIPPWSSRCNWLQLPHNIAGEKWCLTMDECLFTSSVYLNWLHRTNFTYACMTEDHRGLFGACNVFNLAHQFTAKYSSDFTFSDAAWWLVMQHTGVH